MKVNKTSLDFENKEYALMYMLNQQDVVYAEYGLIGFILDRCTDADVRAYDNEEDKAERNDNYAFDIDEVEKYYDDFFKNEHLRKVFDDLMKKYELQLSKNSTDTFVASLSDLADSLSSVNAEDLTKQLEQMLVDAQKVGK